MTQKTLSCISILQVSCSSCLPPLIATNMSHPAKRCALIGEVGSLEDVCLVAGGQSYSVIALLDTIEAIKPDVCTIALGLCASTATVLLAAGAKGKRYAMPSARIMMHQPAGDASFSISVASTAGTLLPYGNCMHKTRSLYTDATALQ